jgi:hypothetical protein
MTKQILFFALIEFLAFSFLAKLVLSKRLLEKYAIFWVLALVSSTGGFLVVLIRPEAVGILGFKVGSNLLIFGSLLLLSSLCLQLSVELSRQEKKLERFATAFAILQSDFEEEVKSRRDSTKK